MVKNMSGLIIQAMAAPDEQSIKHRSADLKGGKAAIQQTNYKGRIRRGANQVHIHLYIQFPSVSDSAVLDNLRALSR